MRRRRAGATVLLLFSLLCAAGASTVRAAPSCSDLASPLQHLDGCNLNHASLTARLALADSTLRNVNLNQASISGEGALLGSNLAGANLNHAQVSGQDALTQAHLRDADLNHAQFTAAAIGVAAHLHNANLNHATIAGLGDFTAATLRGANLEQAVISGIGALTGADLAGADLRGATVTGLDALKYAHFDDTICPDGTISDRDGGSCAGHLIARDPDPHVPSTDVTRGGQGGDRFLLSSTLDPQATFAAVAAAPVTPPAPAAPVGGGSGGGTPPPPSSYAPAPAVVLGGLDLDAYCQSIGYAYSHVPGLGIHGENVPYGPNQAFHWDCVGASGTTGAGFNMQAACNAQYGLNALAFLKNADDAYSWVCVAPFPPSYTETFQGNTYLAAAGSLSGVLPNFVYLGADNALLADLGGGGGSSGLPDIIESAGDGSSVTFSTPSGGFTVAESGSLATGGAV